MPCRLSHHRHRNKPMSPNSQPGNVCTDQTSKVLPFCARDSADPVSGSFSDLPSFSWKSERLEPGSTCCLLCLRNGEKKKNRVEVAILFLSLFFSRAFLMFFGGGGGGGGGANKKRILLSGFSSVYDNGEGDC